MNRREALVAVGGVLVLRPSVVLAQSCGHPGSFIGPLLTDNITADGQKRRLRAAFAYRDKCNRVWRVPKRTPLDGASIPPIFWPVVGKPWEGLYVKASVIHDYGCYRRIEYPWTVHRLFHEGMLVGGVSSVKAKAMYLAVKLGGPTWDWATVDANRQAANLPAFPLPPPPPPPPVPPEGWVPPPEPSPVSADLLQNLVDEVDQQNLSLDDIDGLAAEHRP